MFNLLSSTCGPGWLLPRDHATEPRGNAFRDLVIGHIVSYDGSGTDQSAFSDGYACENYGSAPDRCAALHSSGHHLPIRFGLQPAILSCARIQVVDEHDSVADKYIVFDGDPFTNKSVGRNLAALADSRVFLDLDEGPDLGLVAYLAAVEIDQIRLEDGYSVAQDNVGRDWHEDRFVRFVPSGTGGHRTQAYIRRVSK
jgi:hypothetical protein